MATCMDCGAETEGQDILLCDDCKPEPEEHWHIVTFINGCLNDTDDGPYDTIEGARDELARVVDDAAEHDYPWISAGEDRYVRGNHILKIESCRHDVEECSRVF